MRTQWNRNVALAGETGAIQSRLFDQRQWFAVFTGNHENALLNGSRKGHRTFLPVSSHHQWTHYRKVKLDLPLFPPIYCNIAPHERNATIEVSGVLSLVGQDIRLPRFRTMK